MLQYIHKGHQGKERCLLRARNTVFWPKMTYDVQKLIERCIICQEHGKSQPIIGTIQELPPFPWHTLATDIFYWKRMDFLIVADVFSKYFLVRKLTEFYICSHFCRTSHHCNRIRPTPHHQERQWPMLQFQGVPVISAMIQHHTPNQQPSPSQI